MTDLSTSFPGEFYPGTSSYPTRSSRSEGFIVSVKRAVVRALRAGMDEELPGDDPLYRVKDNIDMEYPADEVNYPGIWVQFSFSELQKTGIDDVMTTPDGQHYQLWNFRGTVTLNVVALSSKERDRIAESIVEMYAFGSIRGPRQDFWEELGNGDYIWLSADKDQLRPGGQTVTVGAPWNQDLLVYEDTYSFSVMGQFASDVDSAELVRLSKINVVATPVTTYTPGDWV